MKQQDTRSDLGGGFDPSRTRDITGAAIERVARALYEEFVASDCVNEYAPWDRLGDKLSWRDRAISALGSAAYAKVIDALLEASRALEVTNDMLGTEYGGRAANMDNVIAHCREVLALAGETTVANPTRSAMTAIEPTERERLFVALKHGDQDHQDWLREAINAHLDGKPVPAPRGSGNKEKRIAELEAQILAMRSSAPQEPDFPSDATKRMAKTLGADFVPKVAQEPDDALAEAETYRQMHATARELGYPSILEALEALSRLKAQEPVAYDDDAERDLRIALWNALRRESIGQDKCYRIINATVAVLQAKAPETGEE